MLVLALVMPFVLAGEATIRVGNAPPAFEDNLGNPVLPNDGWSSKTNPTQTGNEVTFTATATDPNGDDYYLAICKSGIITPNGKKPPTCDGGAWAVSNFAVKSSTAEILVYEVKEKDVGVNEWYAFVCDAVKEGGCSGANQGEGESGSPFYTPRLSTVLRFGADCPELAELEEIRAPELGAEDPLADPLVFLNQPLTRLQVEQMIEDELVSEGDEVTPDLKLVADQLKNLKALEKTEKKASKKEKDAVADSFIAKRDKLSKLADKNVRFCVVTDTDGEGLSDVVDKKEKEIQKKSAYRIDQKDLKLNFRNDADRRIEMGLLAGQSEFLLKNAQAGNKGPAIQYKDSDSPNRLVVPKATEEGIVAYPDVYQTFTLRHEAIDKVQDLGDVLIGLFGEGDTPAPPDSYQMNVLEATSADGQAGVTEEDVIYQSADNRKTDIYRTISQSMSVTPYQIKNYTLYHYGNGSETELYTFENAVLHQRTDGVIEGYYFDGIDLSQNENARDADENLLARASRVMALDRMRDLHENGGDNPDFTIPAPFVLDRQNNVIDTLTYEITGDNYNQFRVSFTAGVADYPLALDPTLLFTAPGAGSTSNVITGETANNYFGHALATGDLDGDGDTDLAVGADYYSTWTGRVYIFYNDGSYSTGAGSADVIITGSASSKLGFSLATGDLNADGTIDLAVGGASDAYIFYNDGFYPASASSADVIITGEVSSNFGYSLATGDLNADGTTDLAVGAYNYNSNQGRAYIFYNDGSIPTTAAAADAIITGETGGRLGNSLATADLDADGDTDIVVGGYGYNSYQGRAYIFYNGNITTESAADADVIITGNASSFFSWALTTGDLDADGDADLIAGESISTAHVYIFYNDGAYPTGAASADVTITGEAGSYIGASLATGDLNADGAIDLVAGDMNYGSSKGRVYIFYNDGSIPTTAATADVIITGESTNDYLGNSLATGDLNADGTIDLAVGAYLYSGSGGTGRAYIFYGEGGVELQNTILGEDSTSYHFGYALTTGDLNADGTTDLAVGAHYYNTSTGRVYIFYNDGAYPTGAASADVTITGEAGSYFGYDLTTGDLNADGTTDLAVGAYLYASNQGRAYIFHNDGTIPTTAATADVTITGEAGATYFGEALTTGDLDGDGTTDLAVGAYNYSSFTGRAYIFHNDGTIPTTAGTADVIITGEANTMFGTALTTGDLNADGTEDLAVGGDYYTSYQGRTYIFYNDGDIPTTAATADVTITGEASSGFGRALTTGDLDADGTTDLVVGADYYSTSTGRAYIFHNDGAIPTTAATADVTITGESGSIFGKTLAVGDLNFDGETDLVVGAYNYSPGGRAYIFYNDGTIPTTAATADVIITGETNDSFSRNLATGDLNADGMMDLAVGAWSYSSNQGRAYIFYGDREYAWNGVYSYPQEPPSVNKPQGFRYDIEGTQSSEELGRAFAVGDFDGDGANDLAVGAPAYNSNQGRVYLFLNDGDLATDDSEADVVIIGNTSQMFGFSLAAGDVISSSDETPDNIDDLVIGAPTNGSTGTAEVYIFHGRSSWSSSYAYSDNSYATAWNTAANNQCGYTVAIGDVDSQLAAGDGLPDIIYSCPGYSSGAGQGIIFVQSRGDTYSADNYDDYNFCPAKAGDYNNDCGYSLAVGDVDRDGDDDIVIGMPGYNDVGEVIVKYNDSGLNGTAVTFLSGETAGDRFGASVAVGPLKDTRDQWDDLVVGAPGYNSGYGRVYVFYNDGSYPAAGSADKIITDTSAYGLGQSLAVADVSHNGRKDLIIGRPGLFSNRGAIMVSYNDGNLNTSTSSSDWHYYGDTGTTGYFGNNLAVGDINNDGWDDIIAGAYNLDSGKGGAYVITMDSVQLQGAGIYNQFAYDYTAGDFNGDGKDDLAVGAPTYSSNTGRVYIFFDNANSLFKTTYASSADVTITGSADDMFGFSLAAGDVISSSSYYPDGIDDLLVGAPTNGTTGTAKVYLFNGRSDWNASYTASTDNSYETAGSTIASYQCGYDVAIGEVDSNHTDGDVYPDVLYSCPGWSNGYILVQMRDADGYASDNFDDDCRPLSANGNGFGRSIAIGDVIGDGRNDIVGGYPTYSSSTGKVGICTNDGGYDTADDEIAGANSGDEFGTSVSVGDLDADGDDDILAGAPEYGTSAGAAYVFYNDGSAYPDAGSADEIITHSTSTDYFGVSVLAADMTNDGRDDIIIGTDYKIYWFYNDGIYPTASSGADMAMSAASGAKFYNLQIGDWNNDGKNDLITGQPNYATDRGLAIIFMGEYLQVEPPTLNSVTITDTSGYTNDSTPNITLSYNSSDGIPTHVEFSCNAGTNWSDPVPYPSDNIINDDADDSVWNMTNGATGCSATNESKTITARLYNGYGYKGYSGTASDTTYYDTAAPTSLSLTANNTSTTQIELNPSASDGSGSGLHATPYYYTEATGASCARTGWTGYIATDPYTWGSLSANTQHSFDFKARDALTNESGYSSCQTLYTSANTPVVDNKYIDDHSTNTTGSIYWEWDSGGSEKNFALDDTSGCSSPLAGAETLTVDYFDDTTPSASNTAYTRYVCARNQDDDLTAAFTLGPAYTLADTPGAPTLSNEAQTTIDVDPVSGGSEKDMAIYVDNGTPCDGSGGYGYVQWGSAGNGGVSGTASWATDASWTTDFTVTGLSSGTTYYFCAKARNEDAASTNDVTPFGSTASTSTTSNPPAYTTLTITDTSGFTNVASPTITYSGLSGGTPTQHKYSCDNSNWSGYTDYENPTTDFDITSTSYGCNGAVNETKTVYVILNNADGDSSAQTDSTYYDSTGPTVSISSAVNDSAIQITVTAGTPDDGSGSGSPYDYYFNRYSDGICSANVGNSGWLISDADYQFGSLSANTEYSFKALSRDELDNVGSLSSCSATYTSANTPVVDGVYSDDHSANTTGSIYWQWDTGGAEKNFALDDTSDCSSPLSGAETLAVDYFNDSTPSASNTAYTRYVCARNEDDDLTSAFTLGPVYTSANTPGAPVVNNPSGSTLDINPAAMTPSGTQLAIRINGGAYTNQYVQDDGSVGASAVWQDDATWGVLTVGELASGTQYTFDVKAKNGDGDETGFGTSANGTTVSAPAYTTLTISDTGGFTNSTNPSMTYGGLSGGTPTQHKYSCDNSNWSGYTDYENPTTDFDITSASYGCNGAVNETKNVYVILNNTGGDSSAQTDSTYYDSTGPTTTVSSAVNDSASQITVTSGTPDDGSGAGSPWQYWFIRYESADCSNWQESKGWYSPNSYQFTSLSANTQNSFKIQAEDELENQGSASACGGVTYTSADTPTTPGQTNQATDSMRWTWVSGGAQTDYAYGDTSSCLTGTTANAYWDEASLSANTAYTRYACARNGDTDKTTALTIGPFYTSADTPGTPTVNGATSGTLDVNPVTGGAETSMAIYAEQGSTCDGAGGEGYVQADGTIDTGEIWQSDGTWDTTTVTGLTGGTQYAFCAKAKNGDDDETAFSATAGTGTTLSTPSFTEGPSDGGSSTTTPTNEEGDVTFTGASNNGASYWLLICNNGSAPTVGSPPECNGGSGNRIARSASAVTYPTVASATHSTSGESSESSAWYAFVCDAVTCSASAQGTGDNGSPYAVNHAPTFGALAISDNALTPDELLTDGDMEASTAVAYTAQNSATLTKETGTPHGGSQVLRIAYNSVNYPSATQAVLTIGKTYRATGWARSDGTYTPRAPHYDGGWVWIGTTSTDWQYFDETFVAGNTSVTLQAGATAAGYAEFDDVSIFEIGTIEPGDTLRFTLLQEQMTETDTDGGQDTINMYVCSGESDQGGVTTAFDYSANTCTNGTLLCSATGINPTTTDATCNDTQSIVSVPTANASDYTVMIYVEDAHSMPSSSGTHNQDYTVADVAPVLTSYSTTDSLSISAGGSDTMSYSVALYDDNGDNDVTDLEMVFFEDTSVNNDCSADENDCYIENIAGNCTFTDKSSPGSGKTALGTDQNLGADCDFTVYFNSTASANWEVQAKPTDGLGQATGFADSTDDNVIASLQGITVVQDGIAYGTLEIGRSSAGQTVTLGNMGNQVIDVLTEGDNMCIDSYSATCPSTYIPLVQQKWHHTSSTFNWSDAETGAGPWILEDTAGTGGDTLGCMNRDIAVRDGHAETTTNEAFYWKILIPIGQATGSYVGLNVVSAASSSSCSGTLY